MTSLSFIVPVYNRKDKLLRSLRSIPSPTLAFPVVEVIVVDDCSSDGLCLDHIISNTRAELHYCFKYIKLPVNMGVTYAKNLGALNASADWLFFLDSDDLLVDSFNEILFSALKVFASYSSCPDVMFFRCISCSTGKLIGRELSSHYIMLDEFIKAGTGGECLPLIKRDVFISFPYNPSLRGCESWAYLNILVAGHSVYLSDKILRVYDDSGSDRLSLGSQIIKRSSRLSVYHWSFFFILLFRARRVWPLALIKSLYYFIIYLANLVFQLLRF